MGRIWDKLEVDGGSWQTWACAGAAACATVSVIAVGKSYYDIWWWRRRIRKVDGSAADGPKPTVVVGNVPLLRSGFYKTLHDYIDCPSSVFWIMSTPFVVVTDPDSVRRVLGGDGGVFTKPKYFGYRSRTVRTAVETQKHAVVSESKDVATDGDASRQALVQLSRDSFPLIFAAMGELLERLAASPAEQSGLDDAMLTVQSSITRLNLNVLFQWTDTAAADDVGARIVFAGREFARQMVDPWRVLFHPIQAISFVSHAISIVKFGRKLGRHLDQAAEEGNSSWVHSWIGKVGKIGKLGKVTGLLMASTQTVPMSVLWLMHFVYKHPEVAEKLRAEQATVLGKQGSKSIADLTFEDVANMPYADCVVRETLRLRPPFPVLVREAQDDTEIAGLQVPSRTSVYVVPWLVHQTKKSWTDPDQFNPDRFVDSPERGDAPSEFAYVPFSRGSRMCGGYRLALLELKVLLARCIAEYSWETSFELGHIPKYYPPLDMGPRGIQVHLQRRT